MTGPAAHRGRRDNGLSSEAFSPVADVDPRLADHLLDVLLLREVPAYVEPAPVAAPRTADRLYVAADRTGTARELLTQLASELGIEVSHGHPDRDRPASELLSGRDTDAEFNAIVASLGTDFGTDLDASEGEPTGADLVRPLFDPTTSPAVHAVSSEIDESPEHYIPPPAPPVPLPQPATAMAAAMALLGVLVMAFGGLLGLGADVSFMLGVVLVLCGGTMLVMRLRDDDDEDGDDGAVV